MPTVNLTDAKWQQVMACMAYAPAREVVPLLNEIGAQLQYAAQQAPIQQPGGKSDGKEVRHGQQ